MIENQKLYQFLLELNVLPREDLESFYKEAVNKKLDLGDLLFSRDLISDENLGKVIADIYSVPFIRLSQNTIPKEILNIIPEVVAKKQNIISFKKDAEGLHLAMLNPQNLEVVKFISKKTGLPVKSYYATHRDLENAFHLYSKEVVNAFDQIMQENISIAKGKSVAEPPIIKIVETIITYAYQNKASDIHLENQEKNTVVRFRIDGILHDIISLPEELHEQIVTRIKILASLRTDEHQASQDGKITFPIDGEDLDIRVSVVPTIEGEKIVLRLLSEKSRQFSLADLGMSQKDLEKVTNAYEKPYGMILSTGPTGCGKTTTMYAILKLLNKREVNIMTIEDPVEYDIGGINQIQVNPKTNLTFAAGLRSIVRQDPNIILVGEVRDEETAGIAINSAMTGHLVLSTLHTNDAATALPRLLDMQIEPFLVSSSVNLIIAQRLVRKICTKCRYSYEEDIENLKDLINLDLLRKYFQSQKTIRLYKGKGCPVCHDTGYTDRIGIYEILELTNEIKEAIVNKKDAEEIKELALKSGMTTMLEDGIQKAASGITTIEEIIRVTKE